MQAIDPASQDFRDAVLVLDALAQEIIAACESCEQVSLSRPVPEYRFRQPNL